jgi:hypothetical protein
LRLAKAASRLSDEAIIVADLLDNVAKTLRLDDRPKVADGLEQTAERIRKTHASL